MRGGLWCGRQGEEGGREKGREGERKREKRDTLPPHCTLPLSLSVCLPPSPAFVVLSPWPQPPPSPLPLPPAQPAQNRTTSGQPQTSGCQAAAAASHTEPHATPQRFIVGKKYRQGIVYGIEGLEVTIFKLETQCRGGAMVSLRTFNDHMLIYYRGAYSHPYIRTCLYKHSIWDGSISSDARRTQIRVIITGHFF